MSDNTIVAVFGRKGSGKTSLVYEIIAERPRVFVIDSLAEYPGKLPDGKMPRGWEVCREKEACVRGMLAVKDKRAFRLSLRCLDESDNLELMELAYEFPGSTIVVEETSLYCKAHVLPREIAKLVRYGRHREIDQVYVARRPSEISRDLTAQADVIVTFEQREPRDIKFLRDAGFGSEAEQAQTLPKYRVLALGDLSKAPVCVIERRVGATPEKQLDAFRRKM